MMKAPFYVLYQKPEKSDDLQPFSVHDTAEAAKAEARLQDPQVSAAIDKLSEGWTDPEPYGYPRMGENLGRTLQFIVDSDADGDSEGYHNYVWEGWQIIAHNWGDRLEW